LATTASIRLVLVTPFIAAGAVQFEPSDDVAYPGYPEGAVPTATNKFDEFLVTASIFPLTGEPVISAGVVQREPDPGVTLLLAALAAEVPTKFVAVAVNV
jgi:hypothetical protein